MLDRMGRHLAILRRGRRQRLTYCQHLGFQAQREQASQALLDQLAARFGEP